MKKVGGQLGLCSTDSMSLTIEIKAKAIKKHKIYLTLQSWKLSLIAKGRSYIIRTNWAY